MKKTVLTTAILCLFALCDVQAQIDNRYHWYDGTITYTATHLEHSNVKMYGMDEAVFPLHRYLETATCT